MTTLPSLIRVVKTPTIPDDDDERTERRCRTAWHSIQRSLERLATVTDPEVLESADGALYDALFDLIHGKAARRSQP